MDGAVHLTSYSEQKVETIVTQLLEDHNIKYKINPTHKKPLPYSVQHQESDFQYMTRLASDFKEWCYYDGEKVVFGQLIEKNQTELKVGNILGSYDISLKLMPTNFSFGHYSYLQNDHFMGEASSQSITNLAPLEKKLLNISESYYNKISNNILSANYSSQQEVNDFVKWTKASIAADFLQVKGFSTDPSLTLGRNIRIVEKTFTEEGTYIITNIQHSWSDGAYHNEFEAIACNAIHSPQQAHCIPAPASFPQVAVVKENNDPKGLGRVRVQFHWQGNNNMTPWIRVAFPHAGAGGDIYFVPEVGEEVMVGFELGNPDRPYIMGSCYHNKTKPAYFKQDNSIKAITTKDGNRIIMVDGTDGKICILNKADKNKITLSLEKDGLIAIESKGLIALKGKSIELKAEDIKLDANQNLLIKAGQEVQLEGTNLNLKATKSATLEGVQTKIAGQASTEIKAAANLKLEGGALAELKAAMVKIN